MCEGLLRLGPNVKSSMFNSLGIVPVLACKREVIKKCGAFTQYNQAASFFIDTSCLATVWSGTNCVSGTICLSVIRSVYLSGIRSVYLSGIVPVGLSGTGS